MHHKLDIYPHPREVLYINEFELIDVVNTYFKKKDYEKALTGKNKSQGGVLPDDNVRIYVPIDLNGDYIINRLCYLFDSLGEPSYKNEMSLSTEVGKLVSQLEIYDQVWTVRELGNSYTNEEGRLHGPKGKQLAQQFIDVLMENEGAAECFPFNVIDELKKEFLL